MRVRAEIGASPSPIVPIALESVGGPGATASAGVGKAAFPRSAFRFAVLEERAELTFPAGLSSPPPKKARPDGTATAISATRLGILSWDFRPARARRPDRPSCDGDAIRPMRN